MSFKTRLLSMLCLTGIMIGCGGPAESASEQAQVEAQQQMLVPGYSVSCPASPVYPGHILKCSWTAPAGHGWNEWFGLALSTVSQTSYSWYDYATDATSGYVFLHLPTTSRAGETWMVRFYLDNGWTVTSATSVLLTAPSTITFSVRAGLGPYVRGQPITADWIAPAGHHERDWVALYEVGATDTNYIAQSPVYSTITTGSVKLGLPSLLDPAKRYEFRYFSYGTYTLRARSSSFTVQ